MTGLLVTMTSNLLVDRNVFTDIGIKIIKGCRSNLHRSQGYHGLLILGAADKENVTITNNYLDGTGITRTWSTSGIFAQGNMWVTIANNEVTRTAGNGIFIKGESLSKGALKDQVDNSIIYSYLDIR